MIRKIVTIFVILLCVPVNQVLAISAEDQQSIDSNTIYYSQSNQGPSGNGGIGGNGTCTATSSASDANLTSSELGTSNYDYAGRQILNSSELQAVSQNEPTYQQAAQQYNIPWEVLAAIHYRESGLKLVNEDSSGLYAISGASWPPGPVSAAEFSAETQQAASFIHNQSPDLTTSSSSDIVKQAFFDYNGAAHAYVLQALNLGFTQAQADIGEGSPYVMNGADQQRDPSVNTTTWGQVKVDNGPIVYPADAAYGAYIVYADLVGMSGGSVGLSSTRQNVVCIAEQQLADWSAPNFNIATGFLQYSQGNYEEWCADFASWVYDQAGYPLQPDPNWRVPGVAAIEALGGNGMFVFHPEASNYIPQPGDLAIHWNPPYEHVNIVVGVSGTTVTLIGGDQSNPQYLINGKDTTNYGTQNPPSTSLVSTETLSGYYSDSVIGYLSPNN
jgi:hypothetical protein